MEGGGKCGKCGKLIEGEIEKVLVCGDVQGPFGTWRLVRFWE